MPQQPSALAPSPSRPTPPIPPAHHRPPRYRRWRGAGREVGIHYAVFLLTAVLVLAPVVPILYQSLRDRPLYEGGGAFVLDNYVRLFTEAGFGHTVVNTLLFAVLTTLFALGIAVPMAVLLTRTRFPGARLFAQIVRWPIYLSPLVLAFGWIVLYGPAGFVSAALRNALGIVPWDLYSLPGMAFVEAVAQAPIAYLFCANALASSDASLEHAARVCGAKPARVLRSTVLPMLRPPVLYASLLIFGTAVETLSIPLILGEPNDIEMFSSFLYSHGMEALRPDYGLLGAASTLILAATVCLSLLQIRLLKHAQRYVSVRGKATRRGSLDIGAWRWLGFGFVTLYLGFGVLLPMAALVLRAFSRFLSPLISPFSTLTLDNFRLIFAYEPYAQSITNSLLVALTGAAAVTLFGALVVLTARRSRFRLGRWLEVLALSPQAIPGLIIGIGLFWAIALAPSPISAPQGTLVAVVIAFGIRALPSSFGSISPAVLQLGQELDNAARVAGADWWRTVTRVHLRLIAPALVASFLLIWVQMIREYAPAMFLAGSDSQVIGTTAVELWTQGETGSVAALSTIQIAVTVVAASLVNLFIKEKKGVPHA
ncbi:ABC transporter permease [Streptomyces misionensis]|uniref:ABC transporter permease n=1 Tax=Streptomyces misionensis TaxID=67331 RepID=UPI0036C3D2E5